MLIPSYNFIVVTKLLIEIRGRGNITWVFEFASDRIPRFDFYLNPEVAPRNLFNCSSV